MYIIRNFIQLISYMIILYKVYFRIVIRKIQYIILITAVSPIYIYKVYYTFELTYEKS